MAKSRVPQNGLRFCVAFCVRVCACACLFARARFRFLFVCIFSLFCFARVRSRDRCAKRKRKTRFAKRSPQNALGLIARACSRARTYVSFKFVYLLLLFAFASPRSLRPRTRKTRAAKRSSPQNALGFCGTKSQAGPWPKAAPRPLCRKTAPRNFLRHQAPSFAFAAKRSPRHDSFFCVFQQERSTPRSAYALCENGLRLRQRKVCVCVCVYLFAVRWLILVISYYS